MQAHEWNLKLDYIKVLVPMIYLFCGLLTLTLDLKFTKTLLYPQFHAMKTVFFFFIFKIISED